LQKRGFFITRYDLLGLATVAVLIGAIWLFNKMVLEPRSFSSSRNKMEVLNSQLSVVKMGSNSNVVVIGVLTNRSDYSWRMGIFELRFLDASGNILDAAKGSDADGFTVLPHSDHSFHLVLYSLSSIPEYASYMIAIRSAYDPDQSFW
jgi:hypothetical protein